MCIKNKPYCIEERAKKFFGLTDIFEFSGYLLEDGTMLNFSYEGHQRDIDHRDIGQFFKKADGTTALLKFMHRGNIRTMCDSFGFRFEIIKTPTPKQIYTLKKAYLIAIKEGIDFLIEKDNKTGKSIKCFNDISSFLNYIHN